jgi:hypothetical protein
MDGLGPFQVFVTFEIRSWSSLFNTINLQYGGNVNTLSPSDATVQQILEYKDSCFHGSED